MRAARLSGLAGVIATLAVAGASGALAQAPSPANCFYVPEAVTNSGVVVDGWSDGGNASTSSNALFYFKTCPNNHGGGPASRFGFLTNNARIRILLRDASGEAVPNFPADAIYILLNGGTAAQGYAGDGADSIIANSTHATTNGLGGNPLCPNLRRIEADGPTNAAGETYITLTGSTPGSPGIGTRDPSRKWGHNDSAMPVFVAGFPIEGQLAMPAARGSYVLRIRNVDHAGGLTAVPADKAEIVEAADFNQFIANPGTFWNDFDASGGKTAADMNVIIGHLTHDCATPANP